MLNDLDAMIAAIRRKLHKRIESACQQAKGRPRATANRSAGQLYRVRKPKETT